MKNLLSLFLGQLLLSSLSFAADPMNSFEKIEADLAAGKITAADSIGYKALAFWSDPYLPKQYESDADSQLASPSDLLVGDAKVLLPEMSESLAKQVYYNLIPPPYRPNRTNFNRLRSNFTDEGFPIPSDIPSADWAYIDHVAAGVRVWYEKDNQEQFIIAHQMKNALGNYIIDEITKLMGRRFIPDDLGNSRIKVRLGLEHPQPNGGDGKLDVYLFNLKPQQGNILPPRAWASPYNTDPRDGYGCPSTPSYMAVDLGFAKKSSPERVATTLAHEYFHVIQYTHDRKNVCSEYFKSDEGTATYAKHHVYPNMNHEHEWYEWFEDGSQRFHTSDYDTWPFYMYMVQMQGSSVLQEMYKAEAGDNAYESINKVLNGGFKKHWLDFAVYNWNTDPLQDGFKQWDRFAFRPGRRPKTAGHLKAIEPEKVILDSNGQYSKTMDLNLPPLTRDFYAFDLRSSDIRSVSIDNPIIMSTRKVNAKVLLKRRGQTQFEEVLWQDGMRHEYAFCLDKQIEDYEQIVVIVGNYLHQKSAATHIMDPRFKATNQGCHTIKGRMRANLKMTSGNSSHESELLGEDLVFKESGFNSEGIFKGHFHMQSGKVSYTYTGKIDNCTGTAAGYLDIDTNPNKIAGGSYPYNVAPEAWGAYTLNVPFIKPYIMVHYVCPAPKPSFDAPFPVALTNGADNHGGLDHWLGLKKVGFWDTKWDLTPVKE